LLEQLSLYAALPLLLSVTLATSLGFDWSRMIWGRVLLVWCVVFELCRRNNVLPEFLQLLLLAGTLILFWPLPNAARQRTGGLSRLAATAAFGWLLLCVIGLLLPSWLPVPLLLAIATLLIFITSHRRQNLPG